MTIVLRHLASHFLQSQGNVVALRCLLILIVACIHCCGGWIKPELLEEEP